MKKFSLIVVLILSLGLMAFGCNDEGVGTPTPAGAQTPTGAETPAPGGGTTPLPGGVPAPVPGGNETPVPGGNVTPAGPAGEDIVDILAADERFGTLVTALEASGAVDALRAEGPFTVFVPTDEAFARLPIGMLEELLGTPAPQAGTPTPEEGAMGTPEGGTPMPEEGTPAPEGASPGPEAAAALTNILLYHVVPGVYTSADLANTTCLDTFQGQPLFVSVEASAIFVNDVPVVEPDIQAANGVIHVIDGVLLPPTVDIIKTLTEDGRFTKLVEAIEAGTLTDTLLGEGPFTLFAPTDDAFAKLPAGTLEGLIGATPAPGNVTPGMATPAPGNVTTPAPGNVTPPAGAGTPSPGNVTPPGNITPPMGTPPAAPGAVPPSPGLTDLQNLLLYHVVSGEYVSCDFANTTCLDTVQGRPLVVSIDDDTVLVNNEAEVIEPNILVPNGVIHVIDEVLLPPTKDIAQTLTEDGRFSTLLQALEAANLTGPLTGEGPPLTLFAPTDEAFAQLPAGTIDALLGNITALQNVLLYHVAPDEYLSCDLANTTAVPSVQGLPLIISSDDNTILVNDAEVVEPNVLLVPNGVIHVVDKVLVPPDKDVAETLIEDGRFTTLIGALEAAELTAGLQGEGPFTVFAPSDDAFAGLPPGTLEELGNNTAELQNVLLYHVVPGIYTAGDLAETTSLDSIQGQALTITTEDGAILINEARVVEPNILVSNGIVHVVDGVLIPPG